MMSSKNYILLVLAFLSLGCDTRSLKEIPKVPSGKLRYDIKHPSQKFFMPDELEEISGITYYKPGQIMCVQDEEGKVFLYNLNERKVSRRIRFAKDGDYEDLVSVGEEIYVAKSNGTLHHFVVTDDKMVNDDELDTPLTEDNDIEGICLDPVTQQLWIACKGDAGIKTDSLKGRAVYAYDLQSNTLNPKPVIFLTSEDLESFVKPNLKQTKKKKVSFKPSAIAVSPLDKRIYLLAATGNLLVVLNRDGSIYEAIPLSPKVFRQPEGLCFSPEGDMFIASEGDGEVGYIVRFEYLK
ncbi:SdiA-regulated domain-containing protein [Cytophagaceae bacterium YF14B1]|uniref:SdiA-regulated domain-containing protein n=1 Tax=Xanthocytophaga flava TaxID=3048013 RepID=A0AAE3UBJ7_9BACT|nr:SdiA-regulated domain-containing protein [Xanthocytophaga flavus]MDJ1484473.1 SdiA-regulated domain-containing protein [Xanthocytophaga flavus]